MGKVYYKKTLQRMAQSQEITPKPGQSRGRPPGSLNKKTIERIKQQNENSYESIY